MAATFANLTVLKLTVVKDVSTSTVTDDRGNGFEIDSLTLIERAPTGGYTPHDDLLSVELPDWYSTTDSSRFTKETHTIIPRNPTTGMVVIDASEVGDVIVLSEADYTQGREVSTERIENNGTPPAINDDQSMGLVFPFVMTNSGSANNEDYLKSSFTDIDNYLTQRTASQSFPTFVERVD